jgi:hypothetical protein
MPIFILGRIDNGRCAQMMTTDNYEDKTMTKLEFDLWKQVTAASRRGWVIDPIQLANHSRVLAYKGGESGTYVEIEPNGKMAIGVYEGAVPHIGEAIFTEQGIKQFDTAADAYKKASDEFKIPNLYRWSQQGLSSQEIAARLGARRHIR